MKIITHREIKSLKISPLQCYEWVDEALRIKANDKVILPPKISIKPVIEGSFINIMPCVINKCHIIAVGGVKVVTRFPNKEPSLESHLLLVDAKTGNISALMDANFITAMRTGAVAAHSVKLLAKKEFNTIALMGLGNVLYATFLVLMDLYPEREFHIKLLKYKRHHEKFIDRFKKYTNLSFECCNDADSWAKGSDVIISGATYLPDDICKYESFDKGVLLVPIHTRGFTNCDLFFDKIYGDDKGHIEGFKYFDRFRSFAEICDVINGIAQGRVSDEERIIAYNVGIALHDVYFASKIFEMLNDGHNITDIDLEGPKNKLWL